MADEAVAEKVEIIIRLEQTDAGTYNSTHEIKGEVDPATAAWILIDIGRNILLAALREAHEHHEHHEAGKDT